MLGTPSGSARFIPGDEVEVEIDGVGISEPRSRRGLEALEPIHRESTVHG